MAGFRDELEKLAAVGKGALIRKGLLATGQQRPKGVVQRIRKFLTGRARPKGKLREALR